MRMMKKIMFFVAAAFALVAVGCSKDDVANEGVEYVSELKLNFGKGDSRVAVTHNPASGLKFAWEDGEEIEVYENGNENSLTYYYVYDAATESFKPESDSYKMVAGKEYFAVNHRRQTSIFLSVEDGKSVVKMNIERKEPYGLSNIPMITDVFTADNTNIENMMNKSRGDYAYTMIDVDGAMADNVKADVDAIDGVIKSTIYTA